MTTSYGTVNIIGDVNASSFASILNTVVTGGVKLISDNGSSSSVLLQNLSTTPTIQNATNQILSIGSNDIGNTSSLLNNITQIRSFLGTSNFIWILPYNNAIASIILNYASSMNDKIIGLSSYQTTNNLTPTNPSLVTNDIISYLTVPPSSSQSSSSSSSSTLTTLAVLAGGAAALYAVSNYGFLKSNTSSSTSTTSSSTSVITATPLPPPPVHVTFNQVNNGTPHAIAGACQPPTVCSPTTQASLQQMNSSLQSPGMSGIITSMGSVANSASALPPALQSQIAGCFGQLSVLSQGASFANTCAKHIDDVSTNSVQCYNAAGIKIDPQGLNSSTKCSNMSPMIGTLQGQHDSVLSSISSVFSTISTTIGTIAHTVINAFTTGITSILKAIGSGVGLVIGAATSALKLATDLISKAFSNIPGLSSLSSLMSSTLASITGEKNKMSSAVANANAGPYRQNVSNTNPCITSVQTPTGSSQTQIIGSNGIICPTGTIGPTGSSSSGSTLAQVLANLRANGYTPTGSTGTNSVPINLSSPTGE